MLAIVLVLFCLYFLGLFVRSRVHRAVDWVMLHVPVVNTIFKAVSNVFQSLGQAAPGGADVSAGSSWSRSRTRGCGRWRS